MRQLMCGTVILSESSVHKVVRKSIVQTAAALEGEESVPEN